VRCFGVEGDAVHAGLGVARRPAVRILDHQVTVERQRRVLAQRLDDGQAEREVRDEMVVHHVDMHPVGVVGDDADLVGEPGEVGRQDARRYLHRPALDGRGGGRMPPA
jgi:hypothetical protein